MTAPRPTRLASIDALRGVAILLMVIDHCFDWWLAALYRGGSADRTTELIGTLAAPIFLLLVGVGLVLSINRQRQRGVEARAIAWRLVRRGLLLIAAGYALNLAVFFTGSNVSDIFAVDVLHTIGLGIILGAPVALGCRAGTALALGVVWAVGGALWGGSFKLPPALGAWVNGQTGIGYFPLLPWLAYVWLGIATGKVLWQRMQRHEGSPGKLALPLLAAALGSLALALVTPNIGYRHPHLGFMAFSLMVLFAVWALLYRLETLSAMTRRWIVEPLALMGQVALMLYAFHQLTGYRLMLLTGWVTGRSWRGQYGALNPTQALLGLIGMVVLCYAVSGPWKRHRRAIEAATLGRLGIGS